MAFCLQSQIHSHSWTDIFFPGKNVFFVFYQLCALLMLSNVQNFLIKYAQKTFKYIHDFSKFKIRSFTC